MFDWCTNKVFPFVWEKNAPIWRLILYSSNKCTLCFKICLVISIILLLTTSLVIKCGIWANILSNHPFFFNICATWAIIWYIHPSFDLIRDWLTNTNWQYNEKSWASRMLELFSSKTLTRWNILHYFENVNTKNLIIHHHKSIRLEMHLIVDELILVN